MVSELDLHIFDCGLGPARLSMPWHGLNEEPHGANGLAAH